MNLRDEIFKHKLNTLLVEEKNYTFPEFLRMVRKTLGFPRKYVAEMMGVSTGKLYYLEKGKFVRGPDLEFIISLSYFYDINSALVKNKYLEYVSKDNVEKK
jgi:transcriptional regulator with XRE-family HTH domain